MRTWAASETSPCPWRWRRRAAVAFVWGGDDLLIQTGRRAESLPFDVWPGSSGTIRAAVGVDCLCK